MSYIKKETPVAFPILDSIKNRWSPRVFAEKPLTVEQVHILLEAGRWAPSSGNMQPWRIIWGLKETEMFDRIFNCLDDYNQQWAGNAQMLWLNAFKKKMNTRDVENFHALHDLGLFMGNVINQANSMEIAVHQMAGVRFREAAKEFGFPDDYHVATAVAFGYFGGNPDVLPEKMRKQELEISRHRKSQEEFAFNGNFKNADMKKKEKEKHADFQDEFRRSSNFGQSSDDELKIKGDGELKLKKDREMKRKEEKKTISKIIDDISKENNE